MLRSNSILCLSPISTVACWLFLDAPKITCHPASAYLDDLDINIRCDIISNPSVLNFYWTIDSNGTTLKEDENLAEYRTSRTVHLLWLLICPVSLLCPRNHTLTERDTTRSSAIAEGPRDASCQLKSCQLPRNNAETILVRQVQWRN